jgi:hypothetical protein
MSFRKTIVALSAFAVMAVTLPAVAQTARPGDRAVEDLIQQVKKSEEQFVRALDKNIKKSTIRGAKGEVDVDVFLEDFGTAIERLEDRFAPKYAASAELNAVMQQAGGIEKWIQSQPPALKGRSEWDDFKASLQSLAAAYGSTFPLDETKPPRRMNDLEIQQAADSAIENGNKLSKNLSDVYSKEDKQAKETAGNDIDAMQEAAKKLKARVDDNKPASGEAGVFSDSVKKLRSTLGSKPLAGDAKTASDGISAALAKIEQAFNMTPSAEAASAAAPAAAAPAPAPAATAPASAAPATAAPAPEAPATDAAIPAPAAAAPPPETPPSPAPGT